QLRRGQPVRLWSAHLGRCQRWRAAPQIRARHRSAGAIPADAQAAHRNRPRRLGPAELLLMVLHPDNGTIKQRIDRAELLALAELHYRWKVSRWLRTLHLHPQKKLEVSA